MKPIDILRLKSVFYALLVSGLSFAQDMSKEEVQEDLTFLKSKILEYQPEIERFAPQFENAAESLIATDRSDSLSYLDYLKEVSRLCVMAGEGHYSIGNWKDTIHSGIPKNRYAYFPANVKIIDHRLYVEEDYSNEQQLTVGSEILRINGRSAAAILQEIYFCVPSDGSIITNVIDELDYTFPYKFYFFVDQSEYYGVTLKDASGTESTVSIQALKRAEQRRNIQKYILPNQKPTPKENPVYSLDIEDNFATLTLRSFNQKKLEAQNIKPKKFYKAIFDTLQLAEVNRLVIDLRGNSGGLFTMAQELMPYVITELPAGSFQRKSISWTGKVRRYKFRRKKKKSFMGDLYVLIDGGTFSSGSTLARYLKEHSNAISIGEESGSRYEAFAAGSKQYVTLPNSGMEIGIPRFLIDFGEGQKQQTTNRGVLPDHIVTYTMAHILADRDLHMEKVIEMVLEADNLKKGDINY